jgi:hypothetical protein
MNKRISDLPELSQIVEEVNYCTAYSTGEVHLSPGEIIFPYQNGGITSKINFKQLADRLAEYNIGKAVIRCRHCGQWGARFCECKKCGAPIE